MEPEKPGWMTTEFWLTLVAQVVALLVLFGVVSVADKDSVTGTMGRAVENVFAVVGSAAAIWQYIRSRTDVKQQALASGVELGKTQVAVQLKQAELSKVQPLMTKLNDLENLINIQQKVGGT